MTSRSTSSTLSTDTAICSIVTFDGDSSKYVSPSWIQLNEMAYQVSTQILRQNMQFDRIVTLAKGGWPMTRTLVDFLSVAQVASIGVKFYTGIGERLKQPEVYQDVPVSLKGETVLLFDDVADTGESLLFVTQYLLAHGVKQVTTATLFYKPHSIIKPDFFATTTTSWIVFPYELVETLRVLLPKWSGQGVGEQEVISRFVAFGYQPEQIRFYLSRLSPQK